jgi:methylase of polypeptide subunit release factors
MAEEAALAIFSDEAPNEENSDSVPVVPGSSNLLPSAYKSPPNIVSTISFSWVPSPIWQRVYEPAEDSWLLVDALTDEFPHLSNLDPGCCVEMGTGSGLVLTHLARLLEVVSQEKPSAVLAPRVFFGIDRNRDALELAQQTFKRFSVMFFACFQLFFMFCFSRQMEASLNGLKQI